ncbi:MAG: Hsp70 family protein [Methanomicrobium sp.]|nr:Hsp70 family protein [Methanomicrobium sp.]
MAKYVYGIDLGTTYSCIARINDNGSPEVIKNKEGLNTTPSVVFFDGKEVVVGRVAKDNTILEPENTISFVKTLMGKSDFAINYDGRDITPAEISSYILRKVANDAADITGQEVKDVVITVPAYFGAAERDATEKAGKLADLNVLSIISEPVAAAIYYGVTNQTEEKNILIYDLGGGTFDVTVMKVKPGTIEVICAEGNHDLGGKNWDGNIQAYLEEQFREQSGFDGELDNSDLQDLALKAEKAKMELSERESTKIPMAFQGSKARVELTREKFDELTTTEFLDLTIALTDKAIETAKNKGINVDQILLVGGSTRMPQVSRTLKSKYGLEPAILDPDEAVAKGAAIYATDVYVNGKGDITVNSGEEGNDENKPVGELPPLVGPSNGGGSTKPITTIFSTTKTYGVKLLTQVGRELQPRIFNLILKNTAMPDGSITGVQEAGVVEDNQPSILLEIYESDSDANEMEVIDKLKLGEVELIAPPGIKRSDRVFMSLVLDTSGKLHVHGEAEVNGVRKEVDVDLEAKGFMSEEKFEEIKDEMKKSGLVMQR